MALDPLVVLTGEFKMGADSGSATSFKTDVSSVEVSEMRASVVIPARLDTGAEGKKAGAYSAEITINVIGDLVSTSLYSKLRDAVRNATELYWECNLKPGSVSTTNPKYSGLVAVTNAKIGSAVGGLSQFSVTLPVNGLVSTATS